MAKRSFDQRVHSLEPLVRLHKPSGTPHGVQHYHYATHLASRWLHELTDYDGVSLHNELVKLPNRARTLAIARLIQEKLFEAVHDLTADQYAAIYHQLQEVLGD